MRPLPKPTPEQNATRSSRLRFARVARGMEINELNELAGLGGGLVSRLEAGTRGMGIDVAAALAKELDVSFTWLAIGDMAHLVMGQDSEVQDRINELDRRLSRLEPHAKPLKPAARIRPMPARKHPR